MQLGAVFGIEPDVQRFQALLLRRGMGNRGAGNLNALNP